MTAQAQLPLNDPSSSSPAAPPASPAPAAPVAASPSTPDPTNNAAPAAPVAPVARPDFLPETAWDAEKSTVKLDALAPIFAERAAEQSRKLTLPQAPDAYKNELPADFKAPEGITFEFKADDPLLGQARVLAHELGIPQEGYSKLLSLYAATQVADQATITAAKTSEIAKLGVNGPARVDAVTNWLKAVGGEDASTLIKVMDYAPVAGTVQAFERMMQKFQSQGGANFSQQHRNESDGKATDEAYDKMSYAERREYARKHSTKAA